MKTTPWILGIFVIGLGCGGGQQDGPDDPGTGSEGSGTHGGSESGGPTTGEVPDGDSSGSEGSGSTACNFFMCEEEPPPALCRHVEQRLSPDPDARLALGEDLAQEAIERLDDGAVGCVAVELIVLAAGEVAFLARQGLEDLQHQRRLADSGVARDQHDLPLAIEHARKRGGQRFDAGLATVQALVDLEDPLAVGLADEERLRMLLGAGRGNHDSGHGNQTCAEGAQH